MTTFLRQSTTTQIMMGPFVDATDGVTPETSLSISTSDVQLSKDGGAFSSKSQPTASTHAGDGWYITYLNSTDTNTPGPLVIQINESGALPVWRDVMVVPAAVYDWLTGAGSLTAGLTSGALSDIADEVEDALAAYDAPTKSELDSAVAPLATASALTAAQGSIEANIAAIDVPTPPTEAAIADAVWDEAASGHTASGSFGEAAQADATVGTISTSAIDAILDRTAGIETGMTLRQGLRVMLAALAGELSGADGTTITIRDSGDTKDRITATVDEFGNRTAITLDLS